MTRADVDDLVRVNAANEPEVGPLDEDRIELFFAAADRFQLVELDGAVMGVFVGLVEGIDYSSPNYRWFCARNESFAYIDRIALQPEVRGSGIAAAIYEGFETWAREAGHPVLCAEVNTVPPNPRSLAFHHRCGFTVVDEIAPYGGEERVAMVEKAL